jgi:TRAP-type C4-dicarboxylate transport system permease small subunit
MIFKALDRTLDLALFAVLAAMTAIVATNVFCRFVLGFSLYWGDESAQALLVWLTFLGAAVAVRDRAHYTFDYLARSTRGPFQFAVIVVGRVVEIAAVLGLFYWSLQVAWGIRPWIMPAMEISRVYVYAAGPVGSAFMLLYAVKDLMRVLRERRLSQEIIPAA